MHWQLDWIYFLHNFRTPILDQWFIFLNIFDRQEFFFVLIPLIWLGVQWKWGVRLFYLFIASSLLNLGLKMLFTTPRPFFLDPSVALVYVPGYSFPSGGAQTAILLAGLILKEWKKGFWTRFAAINFFFWVSLSRIYLGVHFPMDVLGGWLVGLFLLILFYQKDPWIERWAKKKSWNELFIWGAIVSTIPSLLIRNDTVYLLSGASLGIVVSLYLASRWHLLVDPKNKKEGALRALIGIAGLFLLFFLLHPLLEGHHFFQASINLVFGLWIGCAVPWIWKKTGTCFFPK